MGKILINEDNLSFELLKINDTYIINIDSIKTNLLRTIALIRAYKICEEYNK